MSVFCDDLNELGKLHRSSYLATEPFPFIVLDGLLTHETMEALTGSIGREQDFAGYKYDCPSERRLAFDPVSRLPDKVQSLLSEFCRPTFLKFLEELSGIQGLVPDPYFRGAGLQQIKSGGKVDIHLDPHMHPKLHLERRLNVMLPISLNWTEDHGGHLEVWSGHEDSGQHYLDACVARIAPELNRMIVFTSTDHSYYGFPETYNCPSGSSLCYLSACFYTVPVTSKVRPSSTVFLKRPSDESASFGGRTKELVAAASQEAKENEEVGSVSL